LEEIKALILDFDGLIVDTETPAYESWRTIYRKFDVDLPMSEWAACVGRGMVFDPHAHLEELIGTSLDREAFRHERQAAIRPMIESQPLLPGVAKLLDEARALDLKMGVASSSPRSWVEGHLSRLGIVDRFQAIKCSEDVSHTKPDPELFLATLASLGVATSQAIAFEDSPNGVLAANRAGLFCVVTTNPITEQLSFDGARIDLQVKSLEEIDLQALIRHVLNEQSLERMTD
jgi:HAD superfamily hydrolase (TIGR01509 family)